MHVCIRYNMERLGCKTKPDRRLLPGARIGIGSPAGAPASMLAQGTNATGLAPLPSPEQVIQRNTDPYAGSLPQGKLTGETIDLTIEQALDMGLKYNLGLYLSDRVTDQARGR